jgi:hypothetical protein
MGFVAMGKPSAWIESMDGLLRPLYARTVFNSSSPFRPSESEVFENLGKTQKLVGVILTRGIFPS